MSIHPPAATAPAAVLLAARDQVVELAVRLPAGLSDVELVEGLQAIQVLGGAQAALEATFLAELDLREVPKKLHWGSTGDWFTHLAGAACPRRPPPGPARPPPGPGPARDVGRVAGRDHVADSGRGDL